MVERFNYENLLVLDDPAAIQRRQGRFEQLFNRAATLSLRRPQAALLGESF